MSEVIVKKECPTPAGKLLIIGGKENKGGSPEENDNSENVIELEVLKCFVELTGKNKPVIEVITTASSVGAEAFEEYQALFRKLGAEEVRHLHHDTRVQATSEELIDRVEQADAFFITGGDQLKLTALYGGTSFLTRLKQRYIDDSIVIGGTSAGAMAMSTPMIYAGNEQVQQISSEIKITTGLEFLRDVCIDTHFVHRSRFIRMAQVIVTNPTCIGLGIEEDTAIIVQNGLEAEVIGSGTVIVIDGFHIGDSNIERFTDGDTISVRNLKVHLLGRGDKYTIPQLNPPHI